MKGLETCPWYSGFNVDEAYIRLFDPFFSAISIESPSLRLSELSENEILGLNLSVALR